MPSLVLIGPAVWPAIGNRQTDKHITFYYVDDIVITCAKQTERRVVFILICWLFCLNKTLQNYKSNFRIYGANVHNQKVRND